MKSELKTFLYQTYCQPIMYYGVENMKMNDTEIKKMQITEGTLIKQSLSQYKK